MWLEPKHHPQTPWPPSYLREKTTHTFESGTRRRPECLRGRKLAPREKGDLEDAHLRPVHGAKSHKGRRWRSGSLSQGRHSQALNSFPHLVERPPLGLKFLDHKDLIGEKKRNDDPTDGESFQAGLPSLSSMVLCHGITWRRQPRRRKTLRTTLEGTASCIHVERNEPAPRASRGPSYRCTNVSGVRGHLDDAAGDTQREPSRGHARGRRCFTGRLLASKRARAIGVDRRTRGNKASGGLDEWRNGEHSVDMTRC